MPRSPVDPLREVLRKRRKYCADAAREPGHNRHYNTARWKRLRLMKIRRNPLCQAPGCTAPATDVDHIVSIADGGDDSHGNLQALCHPCHSRKTAVQDGGFGRARGRPRS